MVIIKRAALCPTITVNLRIIFKEKFFPCSQNLERETIKLKLVICESNKEKYKQTIDAR